MAEAGFVGYISIANFVAMNTFNNPSPRFIDLEMTANGPDRSLFVVANSTCGRASITLWFIGLCKSKPPIFLYLPSSWITPCVGTAGMVHDAYIWGGPAY